jgi:Flp pilus assembly protein TadD
VNPPAKQTGKLALLLLAVLAAGVGGIWWVSVRSSGILFLPARAPAQWIIYPTPADGPGRLAVELSTEFRRSFVLERIPDAPARVTVRAFKRCAVRINGNLAEHPSSRPGNWKHPVDYDVTGLLHPGTNEVSATVFNDMGLPALWLALRVGSFALTSDESWESSFVGAVWKPAQLASRPLAIRPGNALYGRENTFASLRSKLPVFCWLLELSAGLAGGWAWWTSKQAGRPGARRLRRFTAPHSESPQNPQAGTPLEPGRGVNAALPPLCPPAGVVAWSRGTHWLGLALMAAAWTLLWSHNLGFLPLLDGFDVAEHLKYVDYILTKRALPLANEGFQMYQPPLYYLISAGLLAMVKASPYEANGIFVLRLFGLLCGLAAVTLAFLSVRLLFPDCRRRQFFGLALAGLLPFNLYLCHYVTNEILGIATVAGCVFVCLRVLRAPAVSLWQYALIGVLWGVALLAKTSAIVLPPVGMVVLAWNLYRKQVRRPLKWAAYLGTTLVCCLAVCGWHYGRVAARFGNPLITNVDRASGFNFWQQASFRTSAAYVPSGQTLVSPFFCGFTDFPDGVYSTLWGDGLWGGQVEFKTRPPWNYDLMAAGYLFALVPTAAIVIGLVILLMRFLREPQPEDLLLLGTALLCGLLLFYFSLKVPAYSSAKAFYAAGALVSLCVAGATGWDFMVAKSRRLGLALYTALGLWAFNNYLAFWIKQAAPATGALIVRGLASQGRHDLAMQKLSELRAYRVEDPQLMRLLCFEHLQLGRVNEAREAAEKALKVAGLDADSHWVMGLVLDAERDFAGAAAEARRALELAPDHAGAAQALADWLNRAGQKEAALAACREALRISPTEASLHALLGSIAGELRRQAEASYHSSLAASLSPGPSR